MVKAPLPVNQALCIEAAPRLRPSTLNSSDKTPRAGGIKDADYTVVRYRWSITTDPAARLQLSLYQSRQTIATGRDREEYITLLTEQWTRAEFSGKPRARARYNSSVLWMQDLISLKLLVLVYYGDMRIFCVFVFNWATFTLAVIYSTLLCRLCGHNVRNGRDIKWFGRVIQLCSSAVMAAQHLSAFACKPCAGVQNTHCWVQCAP